jgi:hypothetical protein
VLRDLLLQELGRQAVPARGIGEDRALFSIASAIFTGSP